MHQQQSLPVIEPALERLPCLHCGSPDPVFYPNDVAEHGAEMGMPGTDAFYGHCDGCGADGPVADNMGDAILAWNRRMALPMSTAERFQLAQLFVLMRRIDPNGTLERLLERHGVHAPQHGAELLAAVPAPEKAEAGLERLGTTYDVRDRRATLAQAALALRHLARHQPGARSGEPYHGNVLQALAKEIDQAATGLAHTATLQQSSIDSCLAGAGAALRYYAAGLTRPTGDNRPFCAWHLERMACELETVLARLTVQPVPAPSEGMPGKGSGG